MLLTVDSEIVLCRCACIWCHCCYVVSEA